MNDHEQRDTAQQQQQQPVRTVIALFDDTIDAEHALSGLRRSNTPSSEISVILRERVLDPDTRGGTEIALSRVVAASELDAVAGWLEGLASLVLPDRASYLVAGPIGAVLATVRDAAPRNSQDDIEFSRAYADSARQLARALSAFGFSRDEAGYLEARVVAGSPMIAITSAEAESLRAGHKAFARNTAVHLGLARTDFSISRTAARLLVTGPQAGGSVVIADAIAPLYRLSSDEAPGTHRLDWRGRVAITAMGEAAGAVTDVLYERRLRTESESVTTNGRQEYMVKARYLVISSRGIFGLGRQRMAIPSVLSELRQNVVHLSTSRDAIRTAPRYSDLGSLSRQDEVNILSHFDAPLYWLEEPQHVSVAPGL